MTTDLDDPVPAAAAGAGSSVRAGLGRVLVVIAVGLLLTLGVRAFLLESVYVPSPGMEPALSAGSRVLVLKTGGEPVSGDVVVADVTDVFGLGRRATPVADGAIGSALSSMASALGVQAESQAVVSRVVAVGGDTVQVFSGTVSVNGMPLRTGLADADQAAFSVPEGSVWLLSDDHARAVDSLAVASTAPNHGSVPVSDVIGRAVMTYWPLSHVGAVDSTVPKDGR